MLIDDLRVRLQAMGISEGDTVFVSSDITLLLHDAYLAGDLLAPGDIIDVLQQLVTREGNLLFPTYNWGFCRGVGFDYRTTRSETGALSQCALQRADFVRTRHPIYSYAVWGRDAARMAELDFKDAFGPHSIFARLGEMGAKNLFINVEYTSSATFIIHCQQKVGVPYRYLKEFTAEYTDREGHTGPRSYSMYVRDLEMDVKGCCSKMGELFRRCGAVHEERVGRSFLRLLDMPQAYKLVEQDIRYNNSARLCEYCGNRDSIAAGESMYALTQKLFPICRSLTGNGVRETLRELQRVAPGLQLHEVPSGTPVWDWRIPREWRLRDAWIKDAKGRKIIDFRENNLHVVGYSAPLHRKVSLAELREMVHTLPEQPDWVPYVTSYYHESSGFCMSYRQLMSLKEGEYEVCIDSELVEGSLTYADLVIPGESAEEIMFSTYVCHPSMANNELSGPALAIHLAQYLQARRNRYTYRFVFAPETLGAITYLSRHSEHLRRHLKAGFVLTCVGDCGEFSYVASRYGDTYADKVAQCILATERPRYKSYSFLERGSDERQYCAPGVDLPVCSVLRSKYGTYPEYHTSADDLSFVSAASYQETWDIYLKMIELIEADGRYRVTCLGEPQLGRRGLYPATSKKGSSECARTMMNMIAYMDGKNDLMDISRRIGAPVRELIGYLPCLQEAGLIAKGGQP